MEDIFRPPSPGVVPNFANPPFMGLSVIVTAGICLPLVVLFASLRLYAKWSILKSWTLDDYVFSLACPVGIAMIAFEISIVMTGPNGHHSWDVKIEAISKSATLQLLGFSIALGPVLWLLKLTLFCLILTAFGSVQWLKNCAYIGIVVTGLFFSAYTIVVTIACGPRPGTDSQSYLKGLNSTQCSSSQGANAISSIIISVVNFSSDLYILILPLPSIRALTLPPKQKIGLYLIMLSGSFMCICSSLSLTFRIKAWQSVDLTGTQIPLYVVFVLELSLGLMIPCMPSVATVYRHYTSKPEIEDKSIISVPNVKFLRTASSPQPPSRAAWRKTHLSIEEIPYRKFSLKYKNRHHIPSGPCMKALPATPLPVDPTSIQPSPKKPKTPSSFRSMQLPITFHTVTNTSNYTSLH